MLWWTLRQLKSTDEAKRITAIRSVSASLGARGFDHLVPVLEDGSAEVRATAATSLIEIAGARALESLRKHLTDDSPGVRQIVIRALAEFGDERARESLISLLDDRDGIVRQKAAAALADAQSPIVQRALLKYRLSEEKRKRVAVRVKSSRLKEQKQTKRDEEMIGKMMELAAHFDKDGVTGQRRSLVNEVTEFGRALNLQGGVSEMERVFRLFQQRYNTTAEPGYPWLPTGHGMVTVELQWDDIGDWAKRWLHSRS